MQLNQTHEQIQQREKRVYIYIKKTNQKIISKRIQRIVVQRPSKDSLRLGVKEDDYVSIV